MENKTDYTMEVDGNEFRAVPAAITNFGMSLCHDNNGEFCSFFHSACSETGFFPKCTESFIVWQPVIKEV